MFKITKISLGLWAVRAPSYWMWIIVLWVSRAPEYGSAALVLRRLAHELIQAHTKGGGVVEGRAAPAETVAAPVRVRADSRVRRDGHGVHY